MSAAGVWTQDPLTGENVGSSDPAAVYVEPSSPDATEILPGYPSGLDPSIASAGTPTDSSWSKVVESIVKAGAGLGALALNPQQARPYLTARTGLIGGGYAGQPYSGNYSLGTVLMGAAVIALLGALVLKGFSR